MKKNVETSKKTRTSKNIKKGTTPTIGTCEDLDARQVYKEIIKEKKNRPRRAGLSWSDEKKDLLNELWFHYKIKDLNVSDMEKIFCCNIQTICAYAKHLKLKCDFVDTKIDYDYLTSLGIKTKII